MAAIPVQPAQRIALISGPTPWLVQTAQSALSLPDNFKRAQLALYEHNLPIWERLIAQGLKPYAHRTEIAQARRRLNIYAEMVWRSLALRWDLERRGIEEVGR